MNLKYWLLPIVGICLVGSYAAYKDYESSHHKEQVSFLKYENYMLLGEISVLESRPNYNDGYRDAIIKMGGPQSPGSYQDGWDAANKVLGDKSYSQGYHNAIKQFGYTKDGNSRWLIEDMNQTQNSNQPITNPIKK